MCAVGGHICPFGAALRHPHGEPNAVTWNSVLGTSLGIGFFEEGPFRGFMLQKFGGRKNFWLANLLTSLLSVAIHLPGWLSLQLFSWPATLSVFVVSFLLGIAFWLVRSLMSLHHCPQWQ
jgi:membrane protease YdiL (CAAX protease family)